MFYAKSGCISHGKRCIENVLSRKEKSGAWTIGGTSGGKRASEEKPSTVVKVVDEQTDEEILHKAKIDSVLKALTRYFRKMDKEVFLRGGQLEWSCKPHVELSFPSPPSQCKKKKKIEDRHRHKNLGGIRIYRHCQPTSLRNSPIDMERILELSMNLCTWRRASRDGSTTRGTVWESTIWPFRTTDQGRTTSRTTHSWIWQEVFISQDFHPSSVLWLVFSVPDLLACPFQSPGRITTLIYHVLLVLFWERSNLSPITSINILLFLWNTSSLC